MSEQERFNSVPWKAIYEVCVAYLLTKEEFDALTWNQFVVMYRLLKRGTW